MVGEEVRQWFPKTGSRTFYDLNGNCLLENMYRFDHIRSICFLNGLWKKIFGFNVPPVSGNTGGEEGYRAMREV